MALSFLKRLEQPLSVLNAIDYVRKAHYMIQRLTLQHFCSLQGVPEKNAQSLTHRNFMTAR